MVATGAVPQICEDRLGKRCLRPRAGKARALAVAAIRETFEETGLLFGSDEFGAPDAPPRKLGEFAAQGVYPDLSEVTFVARAITPPRRPKRFDTHFFAIDAHSPSPSRITTASSAPIQAGRSGLGRFRRAKELDLPTITKVIIQEVEARIEGGFAPYLPVPFC